MRQTAVIEDTAGDDTELSITYNACVGHDDVADDTRFANIAKESLAAGGRVAAALINTNAADDVVLAKERAVEGV